MTSQVNKLFTISALAVFLVCANDARAQVPPCGEQLSSQAIFNKVPARSNGQNMGKGDPCAGNGPLGLQWECPEYVRRFYSTALGINTSKWGGHAKQYFATATEKGLLAFPNGGTTPPAANDILVFTGGTWGHVAIVTEVTQNSVKVIEQNFSPTGVASLALASMAGTYSVAPRGK